MIIPFTRQLYILTKAGVPLLKALQIIAVELPRSKFKVSLETIILEIQEGKSFSESLASAQQFFSSFYISMIKAAEVSGNLVNVLKELSQHLIQHQRIQRQVSAALMYPLFVFIFAVVILAVLFVFVLPVFVRIFSDLGGELPVPTLILMAVSNFIQRWIWLFTLLGVVIASIAAVLFTATESGRYVFNRIIWSLPLFGKLAKTAQLARFTRTLGTLLSSGVPLIKGTQILNDIMQSVVLRRSLEEIQDGLQQGKSLSGVMEETGVFPLTMVRTIQIGEESGKVSEIFLEIAADFEDEVTFAISGFLSLLEPVLIVVMGSIVGFIVISLFFPILTISGLVK